MVIPAVQGEPVSRAGVAAGVEVEELGRHVPDFLRCPPAGLLPLLAAQPVEGRCLRRRPGVAADEVEGLDGDVELVAAGVFEGQELAVPIAHVESHQAQVAADPVLLVNDRRPGPEVGELPDDRPGVAGAPAAAALLVVAGCSPGA